MKNNGAINICYNVQAVVDSKNHFAIDAAATNDINDLNQLLPMASDAKELKMQMPKVRQCLSLITLSDYLACFRFRKSKKV
ncbi:MAG: hypothetical protein LUG24_06760 [Clostridiales bacterium]|nr:hypothetical protein [Clostridiales bacterium]